MKRNPKHLPETREVAWTICPGETAIIQAELECTTVLIRESWVDKFLDDLKGNWPFGKDEAAIALAAKFTEEFSHAQRELFLRELRSQCEVKYISSGLKFFKVEEVNEYISEWDVPCYMVYLPDPDNVDIPSKKWWQLGKRWRRKYNSDERSKPEDRRQDAYEHTDRAVYLARDEGDADNARRLIKEALSTFKSLGDKVGEAHALHFQGRVEHELGNEDQAMPMYDHALEMAQSLNYEPVIARAKHERARIFRKRHLFSVAEEGFDYAARYYAKQGDEANLQASVNQIGYLAETALHSPEFYLDALERTGVPIGTPEDYLYVRALMIQAKIKEDCRLFLQRLLQKAIAINKRDPRFAAYVLDEARTISRLRNESLIIHLADLLEELWTSARRTTYPLQKAHNYTYRRGTKFNTPDSAARNIEELYEYLDKENEAGMYVYRGQTREYPGPLLPSMYRNCNYDQCLTSDDPLYQQYSLRKCGKKFYGEYNRKFLTSLQNAYNNVPPDELASVDAVYKRVLQNPFAARNQFSELLLNHHLISWDEALRMELSSGEMAIYERYHEQWKPFLDNYHRRTLRMFGFFKPFGYLLGTTLAQQFGLSSQGLDATRSLEIAAFFATHSFHANYKEQERQGIGIIYRFPYEPTDISDRSLNDYNYYNLPSIINLEDVLFRFERAGFRREDMIDLFECYYGAIHVENLKDHDLFMVPESALTSSRVSRQQAVIILPDELRKDRADVKPGVDGITLPEFQFIEDIAAREGVEKFYFHHTGTFPSSLPITREQLWPRDDPFLEIIVSIMTALYPIMTFSGHVVPQRLDLIDGGYNANDKEFLELCKSLAHRDPIVLVSFQELNAMECGTIAI